MNAFWITVVLAVVASAVSASEDSKLEKIPSVRNIIECADGDQSDWVKLESQTVAVKGKFLRKVKRTITYPRDGTGNHELVCIKVIDQIADGTGGDAFIRDGGLGFRFATIHFESQMSKGFKFLVDIYGKPIKTGEEETRGNP